MTEAPPARDAEPSEAKSSQTSDPTQDPTLAPRRWRRRLIRIVALLVAFVVVLYVTRRPLAEFALEKFGPAIVRGQIDQPIAWKSVRFQERPGSLEVTLFELEFGAAPDLRLRADRVQVTVRSWLQLSAGIESLLAVEAERLTVTLPETSEPLTEIPIVNLPAQLPVLPFAVRVRELEIRGEGWNLRGDVELENGRWEARASIAPPIPCGELGTITRIHAKAASDESGIQDLRLETAPLALEVRGGLSREGGAYAGAFAVNLPIGEGEVKVRVPVARSAGDVAQSGSTDIATLAPRLELTAQLAPPSQLLTDLARLWTEPGQPAAWSTDEWGINLQDSGETYVTAQLEVAPARSGDAPLPRRVEANCGVVGQNTEFTLRGFAAPESTDLEVSTRNLDLSHWPIAALSSYRPLGQLTMESRLVGPWNELTLQSRVELTSGSVRVLDRRLDFARAEGNLVWRDLSTRAEDFLITLDSLDLETLGGRIHASGSWSDGFELELDSLDVAQVQPWLPGLREASGRLSGTAKVIAGRLERNDNDPSRLDTEPPTSSPSDTTPPDATSDWDYTAQLVVENGTLVPSDWNGRFRDLSVTATLNPGRLELRNLATAIRGGTLRGLADLVWNEQGVQAATAELDLERVQLVRNGSVRVRASGAVRLTGTWDDPFLFAQLSVDRGIFDRNFYPKVSPGGSGLPFDLFSFRDGFLARLGFDVTFRPEGRFLVRNNVVDIAPYGRLTLGGTGLQPILTGELTAAEGTVKLPHLKLTIDQAEVRFPDDDPFHPEITLSGVGRVSGYTVSCVATGALTSPQASFTSDPYLTEEDVLLLVATGYRRSQLQDERIEQVAAIEVLKIYGPQVWEKLFGRSTEKSILDDITITTTPGESSDVIRVELRLSEIFSVQGELDERGDVNVDIKASQWFRP